MNALIPTSYLNLVASVLLLIAFVCLLVSLKVSYRSHATRLFAICLLASLALFANHWTSYFAAIFIIATAVTELDFLQNLAAIIWRDKHFFNYQTEKLTKTEAVRRVTIDHDFIFAGDAESTSQDLDRIRAKALKLDSLNGQETRPASQKIYEIEEKALEFIRCKHSGVLEKFVRYKKGIEFVEFDGVILGEHGEKDKIFEIKVLIGPSITAYVTKSLDSFSSQIQRYTRITGRDAEATLYLVIDIDLSDEKLTKFRKHSQSLGLSIELIKAHEISS